MPALQDLQEVINALTPEQRQALNQAAMQELKKRGVNVGRPSFNERLQGAALSGLQTLRDIGSSISGTRTSLLPSHLKGLSSLKGLGLTKGTDLEAFRKKEEIKKEVAQKYATPKEPKKSYLRYGWLPPQRTPEVEKEISKGFFGIGRRTEWQPEWNEQTQRVVQNIMTYEDIDDLLENRSYYESQGVDVEAILEYIEDKIGKKEED